MFFTSAGSQFNYTDINGQAEDTSPAVGDFVPTADISATGLKKLTLENVYKIINGLTTETNIVMSTDFVPVYDASATAPRKFTVDSLLAGIRPSFYANRASAQTIATGGSYVKIQFNTEVFDTGVYYDPSTNFRFTPLVAGKYLIVVGFEFSASADATIVAGGIWKNGSEYAITPHQNSVNSITGGNIACLVDFNGSTDYVEGYVFQNTGSDKDLSANGSRNYFFGARFA